MVPLPLPNNTEDSNVGLPVTRCRQFAQAGGGHYDRVGEMQEFSVDVVINKRVVQEFPNGAATVRMESGLYV
jgi:hypothetical protein